MARNVTIHQLPSFSDVGVVLSNSTTHSFPVFVGQDKAEDTVKITGKDFMRQVFNGIESTDSFGNINKDDLNFIKINDNNQVKTISYNNFKTGSTANINADEYIQKEDLFKAGSSFTSGTDLNNIDQIGKYYNNVTGIKLDNSPYEQGEYGDQIPKFHMTVQNLTPEITRQTLYPDQDTYQMGLDDYEISNDPNPIQGKKYYNIINETFYSAFDLYNNRGELNSNYEINQNMSYKYYWARNYLSLYVSSYNTNNTTINQFTRSKFGTTPFSSIELPAPLKNNQTINMGMIIRKNNYAQFINVKQNEMTTVSIASDNMSLLIPFEFKQTNGVYNDGYLLLESRVTHNPPQEDTYYNHLEIRLNDSSTTQTYLQGAFILITLYFLEDELLTDYSGPFNSSYQSTAKNNPTSYIEKTERRVSHREIDHQTYQPNTYYELTKTKKNPLYFTRDIQFLGQPEMEEGYYVDNVNYLHLLKDSSQQHNYYYKTTSGWGNFMGYNSNGYIYYVHNNDYYYFKYLIYKNFASYFYTWNQVTGENTDFYKKGILSEDSQYLRVMGKGVYQKTQGGGTFTLGTEGIPLNNFTTDDGIHYRRAFMPSWNIIIDLSKINTNESIFTIEPPSSTDVLTITCDFNLIPFQIDRVHPNLEYFEEYKVSSFQTDLESIRKPIQSAIKYTRDFQLVNKEDIDLTTDIGYFYDINDSKGWQYPPIININ